MEEMIEVFPERKEMGVLEGDPCCWQVDGSETMVAQVWDGWCQNERA